LAELEN
jgi:ABC-type phosphate transport system auxiliary subunit